MLKGHSAEGNLQIRRDLCQITLDIFHRTRTNNHKIYMEPRNTQKCQSNPEEEQNWRQKPQRPQTILQSDGNQSSAVLTETDMWIKGIG